MAGGTHNRRDTIVGVATGDAPSLATATVCATSDGGGVSAEGLASGAGPATQDARNGFGYVPAGERGQQLGPSLTDAITGLHDAIDTLNTAIAAHREVTSLDVADLERTARRLDAAKLSLYAKADRQGAAEGTGSSSTGTWIATATKTSTGTGASDVKLATALEDSLPTTKTALGDGDLSREAAAIIARTMRDLPDTLTPPERALIEESLVRDAKALTPAKLARVARFALAAAHKSADEVAAHQEAVLVAQETRAYQQSSVTMHDHGDGTTTLRATLPTPVADHLRTVLHTMTSPRRDHLNTTNPSTGAGSSTGAGAGASAGTGAGAGVGTGAGESAGSGRPGTGTGVGASDDDSAAQHQQGHDADEFDLTTTARNADWKDLDWAHKRGRALVDLLEHLDTSRLHGKVGANIIITMTLEQALAAAKTAELQHLTGMDTGPTTGIVNTDTGTPISTQTARRLACNAGILPMILDRESVPLDLGRTARFFTEHQRLALASRYDECAADGCTRPYAWSELHHQDPWSTGGHTNLHLAIPLCGYHHRRIHDDTLPHTITTNPANGTKTVTFGTSDHDRQPQRPLWSAA